MLSKQPQESWWKMMLACTGVLVVEKERSVCVCGWGEGVIHSQGEESRI